MSKTFQTFCNLFVLSAMLCSCAYDHPTYHQPPLLALEQGGQIPEPVLASASKRYEGSFENGARIERQQTNQDIGTISHEQTISSLPTRKPVLHQAQSHAQGESAVLSLVITALKGQNQNATLTQSVDRVLSGTSGVRVLPTPAEVTGDDAPLPLLSQQGIAYVVKGECSSDAAHHETIVFLRLIDTRTGKISQVASGRDSNPEEAAAQAARRLAEKLKRGSL